MSNNSSDTLEDNPNMRKATMVDLFGCSEIDAKNKKNQEKKQDTKVADYHKQEEFGQKKFIKP